MKGNQGMSYLDYDFFEAFKRLDKLCKEIYGNSAENKLGVTNYLEEMDSTFSQGRALVASWNEDYRMLKHTRNIRNEMAHSCNTFDNICTQADLDFVSLFKARILARSDPLSTLNRTLNTIHTKNDTHKEKAQSTPSENKHEEQNLSDECMPDHDVNTQQKKHSPKSNNNKTFLVVLVVLIIVIIAELVVGGMILADIIRPS